MCILFKLNKFHNTLGFNFKALSSNPVFNDGLSELANAISK